MNKKISFLMLFFTIFSGILFAQKKTVTGKVTDEDGLGLPGVSVRHEVFLQILTENTKSKPIQAKYLCIVLLVIPHKRKNSQEEEKHWLSMLF